MSNSNIEILKTATDWAKAEVFSTSFFIFFAVMFIMAGIGFWKLGITDLARAYIVPTLVAGTLLLITGLGLVFTNISRTINFPAAYDSDATAFVESEMTRLEKAANEYRTVVFKAIPIIIAACAFCIIFIDKPIWRTGMITIIAMMAVILLVDGTANARLEPYKTQLALVEKQE